MPSDDGTTAAVSTRVTIANFGFTSDGVYASGLVTGVIEDAGNCTLTATSGSGTFSGSIEAAPAASAMNCGRIDVPVEAGNWTLSLSYASATTKATSETITVQRP